MDFKKIITLLPLVLVLAFRTSTAIAASPIHCESTQKTYQNQVTTNNASPSVIHEQGWDRYVMYFFATASWYQGKIGPWRDNPPGDPGTCRANGLCGGNCATDKIFMTWHFGNGVDQGGWDLNDGYNNIPPFLAVDIDSSGNSNESAMVGDPDVTIWNGKYHMYYEAANDCTGNHNLIFHAESDSLFGPWTKTGEVQGLSGNLEGSGLSWPTTYIENNELYLLYTDGNVQLLIAKAADPSGKNFSMENGSRSIVRGDYINKGSLRKIGSSYVLAYDLFGWPGIKISRSSNKFDFPAGEYIVSSNESQGVRYAQPNLLLANKTDGIENRLYYSAYEPNSQSSIMVCTLTNLKEWDLNNDGVVDMGDYNLLKANFANPFNIFDYNELVINFGK